jgi:hypothetical protein
MTIRSTSLVAGGVYNALASAGIYDPPPLTPGVQTPQNNLGMFQT